MFFVVLFAEKSSSQSKVVLSRPHGAEPQDAVDRHGRNSLHCAVTHARGEVAKYLLEQQVDKAQKLPQKWR